MMNLVDSYKYLFYRSYTWNLKTWGRRSFPHISSTLEISLIVYINLITLLIVFALITGINIIKQFPSAKVFGLVLCGIVYGVNYLVFERNKKYLEIVKRFEGESDKVSRKRRVWFWLYIALTFLSFFTFLLILQPYKGN